MKRNDPRQWSDGAAGPVLSAVPDTGWASIGACRRHGDPDVFFRDTSADVAAAKAVCATCPVRAACLTYAVECGLRDGVWGGLSGEERRGLHNGRGRPVSQRCKNGHLRTAANTTRDSNRKIACRDCGRESDVRNYRLRQKAAA